MAKNRIGNLSSQEIRMELENSEDEDEIISIEDLRDAGFSGERSVSSDNDYELDTRNSVDSVDQDEAETDEEEDLQISQSVSNVSSNTQEFNLMDQLLPSVQNKKQKGGRPRDEIWNEFDKVAGTKRDWKCKHCSKLFKSAQADRLKKHIESSCSVLNKLKRRQRQLDDSVSVPAAVSAPEFSVAVGAESEVKKNQQSLRTYYPKTPPALQNRINTALEKFICSANVPFSVVENPYFQKYVHELRSTCIIPSAKSIGNSMLDELYEAEKDKLKNRIAGFKAVIIQDGWTTNQSEAVIAHALSIVDKVEFLNASVVEEEKKTATTCLRFLNEAITQGKEDYAVNIVGLITDNCNTMIAMRRQFVEDNPNMIAYGCNSHLLNLIGKRMTPEPLKSRIVKVQKFFRNHDLPAASLKKLGGNRAVIPGDTRWNSLIKCFRSYMNNQAKYLEISRRSNIEMPDDIKKTLSDASVFEELEESLKILTPVAVSLDKLQSDSSTVADAVSCWLEIESLLKNHPQSEYMREQFRKGTPDSSVAAYMIHTKYKGIGLPNKMKEAGRRWFMNRNKDFLPILLAFQSNDETFFADLILDESIIKTLHPVAWWRTARNDNTEKISNEFFELCETLLRLPSSTAGLERCFSTLGNIITEKRNRLSIEKAQKLCFVNQALKKSL